MTSFELAASQYRNRAHRGAFFRGAKACHHGKPRDACPYRDHRNLFSNRLTWSRAFRHAWLDGYDAQARRENEAILGREARA